MDLSPNHAHSLSELSSKERAPPLARPAVSPPPLLERPDEECDYEGAEQVSFPALASEEIENWKRTCEQSFEEEKNTRADRKRHEFEKKLGLIEEGSNKRLEERRMNKKMAQEASVAKSIAKERERQWLIDLDHNMLRQQYAQRTHEMEHKLLMCEQEKLEQQRQKVIEKYISLEQEALHVQHEFNHACQQSRYPHLLPVEKLDRVKQSLKDLQESLHMAMASDNPDSKKVEHFQHTIGGLRAAVLDLQRDVTNSNERGDSDARRKQQEQEMAQEAARVAKEQARQAVEEQARQREAEKAKQAQEQRAEVTQNKEATAAAQKVPSAPNVSTSGMPKSAVSEYRSLQAHILEATKSLQPFVTDNSSKKYRFDLQKAVTLTVNAISAQSGQQVIEKLTYLKHLLKKQPVDVSGRKVSTGEHPMATLFCCNLMAKKFVEQGQVAPKHDIFPYASIIVALWIEFPDFGTLFLAHLYQMCPVLVPYYVPKEAGMSDVEHMVLQGYKVFDGKTESEDDFLKRMCGVVRLYAAIIQTQAAIFGTGVSHPHGLERGWMWLARILNSDPYPSLTATALCEFLEVCGYALQKEYKRQFKKLFIVMCKDFLPKIESVTSQRGPMERLKQFLEGCEHSGKVPEPEGLLKLDFWKTKSQGGGIVCA